MFDPILDGDGSTLPYAGMDIEPVTALSGAVLYSAYLLEADLFGAF